MLFDVRVVLPDRPGALARVADLMGSCGGDIVGVQVLGREGGRAIDDFRVSLTAGGESRLRERLERDPAIALLSLRTSTSSPGSHLELDLLEHALRQPERAVETFTDMAPAVFAADWACAIAGTGDSAHVVYCSPGAPEVELSEVDTAPARAGRVQPRGFGAEDEVTMLGAPFPGDVTVLVARSEPVFHPLELSTFRRVSELVAMMAVPRAIALPA
ncbi:ACT domain-containing protein [Motilibacter deserti]|uniref:ACT domain-containing protein n=1 Tax=Motilibacter deserti TaxID=2714956 RepID=A0ABX0H1L3_9ACTN|nr:hypothetical protein [Motilibacter deserti]NHC15766.1 hypothetical protein [Motilibacter deserti]